MFDTGLVATGIAIVAVVYLATHLAPVPSFDRGEVMDRLALPVLGGLLAGRAVAALLDDPASFGSLRAFLVIRGGVEFWPGALVAVALVAIGVRRVGGNVIVGLAELAPFALWAYATFEASCLLRDGCYGPAGPIGLVPDGLGTRMLPLGVFAGVAVAGLAFLIYRLWAIAPVTKLLLAVAGVAAVRSVVSIWLPRIGHAPTRQHIESITVTAVVIVSLGIVWLSQAAKRRRAPIQLEAPADHADSANETAPGSL